MAYDRRRIVTNGEKGTVVLFPKLPTDRSYVTPAGIRHAGLASVAGSKKGLDGPYPSVRHSSSEENK